MYQSFSQGHASVQTIRECASVTRIRLCPCSFPRACVETAYNWFILCQPSDDVGLTHTDSSSERAFNPLPTINSLSGFSNFRWQEPIAKKHFLLYILSSGTDHCTFPDSITSPQLSFHIKYDLQSRKILSALTEEQHTTKHQTPAHRSCWRQASVPEG